MPSFSKVLTASIVVPPGEHTISLSSPGCFLVSSTILAAPITACAQNSYAISLFIPYETAQSAIASININAYAGEDPLAPITTSIKLSSTISLFPKESNIVFTASMSFFSIFLLGESELIPQFTSAGVFGMVLIIFLSFPIIFSTLFILIPAAIVTIIFSVSI